MLKKILIMVGVVLILGAGMMFFGEEVHEFAVGVVEGEEYPGPDHVMPLEEFTVNLADPGGNRFIRMEMYLGFDDGELGEELEERKPEVRTTIISFMRSKTVEDLSEPVEEQEGETQGGMDQLREDMAQELNQILETGEIETVYFNKFVVQ